MDYMSIYDDQGKGVYQEKRVALRLIERMEFSRGKVKIIYKDHRITDGIYKPSQITFYN